MEQADKIQERISKSTIRTAIVKARETLENPKRPDTPELPRHLFSGNDYSNRPASAYNVQNLIGKALEDLNSQISTEASIYDNEKYCEPIQEEKASRPSGRKMEKSFTIRRNSKKRKILRESKSQDQVNEEKDELEDYFEKGIIEDIETAEYTSSLQTSANIPAPDNKDIYQELSNKMQNFLIKSKTKDSESHQNIQQFEEEKNEDEIEFENRFFQVMENSNALSQYEKEFDDLVDLFSQLMKKKELSLEEITNICMRSWIVVNEWDHQNQKTKAHHSRETILKGVLALMKATDPLIILRLCKCSIHIFNQLYKTYKNNLKSEGDGHYNEFTHIFNSLVITVKILYKFSKSSENDQFFLQEKLLSELLLLLSFYIVEKDIFMKCSDKVIVKQGAGNQNKVVRISNDSNVYDLLLYLMGIIKNISMDHSLAEQLLKQNAFTGFYNLLRMVNCDRTLLKEKIPQLLVQITGVLRHFAFDMNLDYPKVIPILVDVLRKFPSHQELVLNISRILSKLSLNYNFANGILEAKCEDIAIDLIQKFFTSPAIYIRLAFILGNLTMLFGMDCQYMFSNDRPSQVAMETLQFYLQTWEQKEEGKQVKPSLNKSFSVLPVSPNQIKNYDEFCKNFSDDVLIKSIRLFANLWISKEVSQKYLSTYLESVNLIIQQFLNILCLSRSNMELIINTLSALSNILFYDNAQQSLFSYSLRQKIIEYSLNLLENCDQNEEVIVECVRIFCNLTRQQDAISCFQQTNNIIQIISQCLASEFRELVYYSIGFLINVSANYDIRMKLYGNCLESLIKVLEKSNFEDIQMSMVVCKVLNNMCDSKTKFMWKNDNIKQVDSIITSLGEECDSTLDVANEEEKMVLQEFHGLLNNLINNLPEITFSCPEEGCGRKFKSQEVLNKHISRRHPK